MDDIAWKLFIYFEPNPSSWSRVVSKSTFHANKYLHNEYLHVSVQADSKHPYSTEAIKNFWKKAMVLVLQLVQFLST